MLPVARMLRMRADLGRAASLTAICGATLGVGLAMVFSDPRRTLGRCRRGPHGVCSMLPGGELRHRQLALRGRKVSRRSALRSHLRRIPASSARYRDLFGL